MAYLSYKKLWESEFDDMFSKKSKVQDMKINQINLKYMILLKKMKK